MVILSSQRDLYIEMKNKRNMRIRRDGMKSTSERSDDTSSKVQNISCDLHNIGI